MAEEQLQIPDIPKKRGRPKSSNSMSVNDRKARQRAKELALIESGDPSRWTRSVCIRILSTDKYHNYHRDAYDRLGELI